MTTTVVSLVGSRTFTVYTSSARTASPNDIEYRNLTNAIGMILSIDVTAISDTPSVTFTVEGVDVFADQTWTIITSAAYTSVTSGVLKIYPGITTSANVAVADVIPPNIRITATHADADSITYSVAAHLIY